MFRNAPLFARLSTLLLCLLAAAPALAFKDSVPDWVQAAIAQPAGKYPPETNAVVLLDETVLMVDKDGKAVEHHRHVVRILRPSGRDEGYVGVSFDKDTSFFRCTSGASARMATSTR